MAKGSFVDEPLLDELITMAEALVCIGRGGIETTDPAKFGGGKLVTGRNFEYFGCPHCKMLEQLKKLKNEP